MLILVAALPPDALSRLFHSSPIALVGAKPILRFLCILETTKESLRNVQSLFIGCPNLRLVSRSCSCLDLADEHSRGLAFTDRLFPGLGSTPHAHTVEINTMLSSKQSSGFSDALPVLYVFSIRTLPSWNVLDHCIPFPSAISGFDLAEPPAFAFRLSADVPAQRMTDEFETVREKRWWIDVQAALIEWEEVDEFREKVGNE
ncbi:hypothetical protein B0H14DRAFT_3540324 [Mycena olivaceomarginata]|nr:hypothetical protein B0H14DRAFT_3540324 [Mycena olivaceomarginata]